MFRVVKSESLPATSARIAMAVDELAPLARAAARRDPKATRTFLATVAPSLLRTVRRVIGAQHPDVEDVTQDAAIAVMAALPSFQGACTVLHFCCRVAVLTALAARRRMNYRERWTPNLPSEEMEALPDDSPSPLANLQAARRREELRALLDALPTAQAEVMALHCVMGFTVDEIAASSGAPRDTVRSRLRAAREALRQQAKITGGTLDLV
jgi:RNA polymerase sigma-70 factor (ECF subfamily)